MSDPLRDAELFVRGPPADLPEFMALRLVTHARTLERERDEARALIRQIAEVDPSEIDADWKLCTAALGIIDKCRRFGGADGAAHKGANDEVPKEASGD